MRLRLRERAIEIGGGLPLVMGILNLGHDSVADAASLTSVEERVRRGRRLIGDGAQIVDVGAVSGRTDTPAISPAAEIELLCPVVRRLAADGITVSVDTWRPEVVEAVLDAGAAVINDVSGLRDARVADLAAQSGAALVVMHTRADPKVEFFAESDDPMADVIEDLSERVGVARERGVGEEQLILDPGLDYAKSPQQSIEILRRLDALHRFERPVLLAVSRKYFIGMIGGRAPTDRLGGTLAAVGLGVDLGAAIVRVHDVREVVEYLEVRGALAAQGTVALRGSPEDASLKWIAPKPVAGEVEAPPPA